MYSNFLLNFKQHTGFLNSALLPVGYLNKFLLTIFALLSLNAAVNGQAPISCLSITKTANVSSASEGDFVKYEITVCNTCNTAANNITVSDVLPRGLLFQTSANLNYANQTVSSTLNLAANSCQTFKYDVLVLLATCTNNQNIGNRARINYNNQNRNSNNANFTLIDVSAANCQPANFSYTLSQAIECGLLLPALQSANTTQNVALGGKLIIDQNYTLAVSRLDMKAGAQINVLNGVNVNILSSTIGAACQYCMWRGFVLESKANVAVGVQGGNGLGEISAAQYGFELKTDAQLDLKGVDFRDNFVDVYMAPLNNPILQAPQRLNLKTGRLRTSNGVMLKPFVGIIPTPVQRTNPLGGLLNNPAPVVPIQSKKGLASIYVSDAEILDVRVQNPSLPFNQYFEMSEGIAGIVAVRVGKVFANSNSYTRINEDIAYNTGGNIAWQGTGLYAQGVSGSTAYNVDVTNTASFLTHERCDNGVVGRSVNMIVRGQNMRNISKAGITSRLATNCSVILESNQLNCQTTGIDLLYNDPAAKIEAKGNSISVTPPSTFTGTTSAIRILEGGNAYNNLDIQNNTLVCNNARAQVGLLVNGHTGGKIFNNDVYLQGNGNSPFFLNSIRTAMGFQNTNTDIDCNSVNPSGTGINSGNNTRIQNIMAINISGASGGRLSCNTVDKTFGGLRFENTNAMLVQGNVLQNHTYGLWFTPTATLNRQDFTGNRFIGTNIPNNGFEAYNQNPLFMSGRFTYSSVATSDLIPFPQNTPSLFTVGTSTNDFNCNIISPVWAGCGLEVFRLAAIDDKDRAVANGSYAAANQADMFENKKQLYRKLRRHSYLLQNEPIMQQFDNTESQTNIGAFDWVNTETATVLRLDSLDSLQIQNYQNQALSLLDSMALLDSLRAWAAVNNTVQRDNLSAQWAALQQQQNTVCQNKKMLQVQTIDAQLLPVNQAINATLDHETAEKLVNEIYLQTLAKGVDVYSSNQEQTLQLISVQCPDVLGTVVYKARAMYALAAYVDMFDKSACANTNNLEAQPTNVTETVLAENGVILYPNPAQDVLILQNNTVFAENTIVEIYNSLGQLMQIQNITTPIQRVELNVSTYSNGTYFVRISNDKTVLSKLFIISK